MKSDYIIMRDRYVHLNYRDNVQWQENLTLTKFSENKYSLCIKYTTPGA